MLPTLKRILIQTFLMLQQERSWLLGTSVGNHLVLLCANAFDLHWMTEVFLHLLFFIKMEHVGLRAERFTREAETSCRRRRCRRRCRCRRRRPKMSIGLIC